MAEEGLVDQFLAALVDAFMDGIRGSNAVGSDIVPDICQILLASI